MTVISSVDAITADGLAGRALSIQPVLVIDDPGATVLPPTIYRDRRA